MSDEPGVWMTETELLMAGETWRIGKKGHRYKNRKTPTKEVPSETTDTDDLDLPEVTDA